MSSPVVESSGTQAATIGTEHTLAAPTTAGTRVLIVDVSNMAAGDALELRIKAKVLAGGTIRVAYKTVFYGAQDTDDLIKNSIPEPSDNGATFTLKQTAGTGRNFDWKVLVL